jgi:hypothetical protein
VIAAKTEADLYSDLLRNYHKLARPVQEDSDPVEVLFGLSLQEIVDLVFALINYGSIESCIFIPIL